MTAPSVGFRNGYLVAKNITFDYTTDPQPAEPPISITQDAQLLIGSIQTVPDIAMTPGNLISSDGSITITYDFPNLDLKSTSSGVLTLTGNLGGPINSISNNFNILTANTTAEFVGTAGQLLLDFGLTNLVIGSKPTFGIFDNRNVGLGQTVLQLTSGGSSNTGVGNSALSALTNSSGNVALGDISSAAITSGSGYNTAVGTASLCFLTDGTHNIAIGHLAGSELTGLESDNIYIGNDGVLAESAAIRIGEVGLHTAAFEAGIYGVTVAASQPMGVAATGQLNTFGFGTAGQVLTSGGDGVSPSWQAAGAGSLVTLTGNTGGAVSPSGSNINLLTSGMTPVFSGAGSTLTLNGALTNLAIGSDLPAITTATLNSSFGNGSLAAITSGSRNAVFGTGSALALTTAGFNTIVGAGSGTVLTGGASNTVVGASSFTTFTTGASSAGSNTAVGAATLTGIATGIWNSVFGTSAGANLTLADSSNILISNNGTAGDSNTIRIGTQGTLNGRQNRAFVAGITGVTVASSAVVGVDSLGQLSSLGTGALGQVLTSTGTTSPTWQNSSAGTSTVVTTYNASGTWTINANAKVVRFIMWGGGGGGGSGRCGDSNTSSGGGGGAPGFYYDLEYMASTLTGSPYTVTVGAGGAGGASVNAALTNGNPGIVGGATSVGPDIVAAGGFPGSGGRTTTGTSGGSYSSVSGDGVITAVLLNGGAGQTGAGSAPLGQAMNTYSSGGGGGGGYTSGIARNGGAGQSIVNQLTAVIVAGGAAGVAGADGGNGSSPAGQSLNIGGTGGGAGGNNGITLAGNGGNGAAPAGGGGGGGGNLNLNPSGAGGNGAAGKVIIIEYL